MADNNFLSSLGDLAKLSQTIKDNHDDKEFAAIPVDQVYSRKQPRVYFEKLDELADSLKTTGQQQPIVVSRDDDGKYVIEQGERRWRAAKIAGLAKLYCVIVKDRKPNDQARMVRQLTENIQRDNMKLFELSQAVATLIDEGMTVRELARQLGKKESYVSTLNAVAKLPKELESLVKERIIQDPQALRKLQKACDEFPRAVKSQAKKWTKKAKQLAEKTNGAEDFVVSRTQVSDFIESLTKPSVSKTEDAAEQEEFHPGETFSEKETGQPVDEPSELKASVNPEQSSESGTVEESVSNSETEFRGPVNSDPAHQKSEQFIVHVVWQGIPARLVTEALPPKGKVFIEYFTDNHRELVDVSEVRLDGVKRE